MVRNVESHSVRLRQFVPVWLVEINNPGAGPQHVIPGRTRESCQKWVDNFNSQVSKTRTSGPMKVARVISITEKDSHYE